MDQEYKWTPYILRYLRMKRGWSLHDTVVSFKAKFKNPNLKLAKNQVLEYELGTSIPRADRIAQLCTLFECEPSFLYTRSKEEVAQKMGDHYEQVVESITKVRSSVTRTKRPSVVGSDSRSS